MSKPSPPPSPSRQQCASDDDDDASLDASLQQTLQHAMAATKHKEDKSYYEVPLCKPIGRDYQEASKIFPPPLPMLPDLVTKKPAEEQAGVSARQDSTYASFLPSTNSEHPSYFDNQQQKQPSSSHSTPSINRSASSSSFDMNMNNEVVPNVSAYFLYQNATRDHFKSLNPQMSQAELSKLTSQQYKSLGPQEKVSWTAQASLLNAARLNAEQSNSGNHLVMSKKSPSKKRKDPDAPKRAVGAYVWFTMEERPKIQNEIKGIKFAEMGKLLGERWRGLTPGEKRKYNIMASEDRGRVQTELKAYKEKQTRQQKARKAQADSHMQQHQQHQQHQQQSQQQQHQHQQQQVGNRSQPQHAPQPVADIIGYNHEYDYSDEFCSDIIKRLSED